MKSTNKSISLLAAICFMIIMFGCQDDPIVESQVPDVGEFTTEVFDNLTVEQFTEIETPFENLISTNAGGRALNSTDALVNALKDVLTGSVFLEIEEGEERGLPVYKIKFLLPSGATIEVVVIKEIEEILEVEGHTGPFDYDIDPQGSFISLSKAFEIAKGSIDGEIVRWELELEEDNVWEYEIHIRNDNGRFEVEIDAFTGDLIATNLMDEQDDDEFEEEEKEETLPENVAAAVAVMIDATVVYAEMETEGDKVLWYILVETASGAQVFLVVTGDTEDLIEGGGEVGPFDYDLNIGEGFISLKTTIEVVEAEFQSKTAYWEFGRIEHQEEELWVFIIKVKNNETGSYHRVTVDALTGDWLKVEDDKDDDKQEIPENILLAVESIISGDIVEADKHEEGDRFIWKIYVKTASEAVVKLVITDDTEDLIYAEDEHGPFDYDLFIAEGFVSLQATLNEVVGQMQGQIVYWYFDRAEINQEEFWVFVVKVETATGKFKITVDAQTGNWLSEEAID